MQGYYHKSDINNTCYYTINGNYMCYNNNVIENMENNNNDTMLTKENQVTGYNCNPGVYYPGNDLGTFELVRGTTDNLLSICPRICNKYDLCKGFITNMNNNSCTLKTEFEGTPQTANIDPNITQTYKKVTIDMVDPVPNISKQTTIDTFIDNPQQIEDYTFQKQKQVQENFADKPKLKGYKSEVNTEYGGNDWGRTVMNMNYTDKVDILDICSTGCSTSDNCAGYTVDTTTMAQCFMKTVMKNPAQDKNRNAFIKASLDLY